MVFSMAILLSILLIAHSTLGMRVLHSVPTGVNMRIDSFLAAFCFMYSQSKSNDRPGLVEFSFESEPIPKVPPEGPGLMHLAFYDDQRHPLGSTSHAELKKWSFVWKNWDTLTCQQKLDEAIVVVPLNSVGSSLNFSVPVMEHIRPRYWYLAIIGCDVHLTKPAAIQIHLSNPMMYSQKELSFDHAGVHKLYIIFFIFFAAGFFYQATSFLSINRSSEVISSATSLPFLQFMIIAWGSSMLGTLLLTIHWWTYLKDGWGIVDLQFMGQLSEASSKGAILVILLLVAHGLSSTNLHVTNKYIIFGVLGFFGLTNVLTESIAVFYHDPSNHILAYQSSFGLILLFLHIILCFWFILSIKKTFSIISWTEGASKQYYKLFGMVFSTWFMVMPLMLFFSHVISPWYGYIVVTSMELCLRLIFLCFLSYFLWPTTLINAEPTYSRAVGGYSAPPPVNDGFVQMTDIDIRK
eukprot:GHVL01016051.1.p1 GENE.GHVL01016051.1~~GHVL01016051.1.p1  ORF type:complete len:465 (+),score=23.46 GHVL01016051.1:94-1488(+)